LERHVISPADFTVEISGLNHQTTIEDIEEFFSRPIENYVNS
jgi:hypothetical protein